MRYLFRHEVEHLLARSGFAVEALYGDYDRSPFGDDSPELIVVARPVERLASRTLVGDAGFEPATPCL